MFSNTLVWPNVKRNMCIKNSNLNGIRNKTGREIPGVVLYKVIHNKLFIKDGRGRR